jgi:two-component system, NarL family, sensor histidine kinase DevS
VREHSGIVPMQSRVADTADVLATLLQSSPDAVIAVDRDGLIVLASEAIRTLFGFGPDEVVGLAVETLVPEQARAMHERHRRRYTESGEPRPMGLGLELMGRRRDGSEFPIDVSLAPFVTGGERFVGAFVRDATDRRRQEARLHAINEITQRLLAGEPTAATLELVACRARGLVDAALGWVVVPSGKDGLVVSASDGQGAESIIGIEFTSNGSIAKRSMTEGETITVPDLSTEATVPARMKALGLGPSLFCPLGVEDRILGALVVARPRGATGFNANDTALVEVFANAAMVALTLGEARVELEQLQATAERERIGRDLHDTVIQQLFALGMGLQSIERLTSGSVAGRIDRIVDGLDEVIREIRETIFHLERPAMAESGLRAAVNAVVGAAAEPLGFRPRVGFQGPVDAVTSDDLESQVLAVLTEVLSNVARHAGASAVELVIAAEDNMLLVSVADNGVGPPKGRTAGNGLRNIAERARALGGSVSITARSPSGTLVEWSVPIPR